MSRIAVFLLFIFISTIVRATDVQYCEENPEYEVKVKEVYISPYPIVLGEPATFTISANTGRGMSGGKLVTEVSYFGWHVHSVTHDLCTETTCPVKPEISWLHTLKFFLPILLLVRTRCKRKCLMRRIRS